VDGGRRRVILEPEDGRELEFLREILKRAGVEHEEEGGRVIVHLDPDSAVRILEVLPPKYALAWPTGRELMKASKEAGQGPRPSLHAKNR